MYSTQYRALIARKRAELQANVVCVFNFDRELPASEHARLAKYDGAQCLVLSPTEFNHYYVMMHDGEVVDVFCMDLEPLRV